MILSTMFHLARPVLFAMSPEDAHELTLKSLEKGLFPRDTMADQACLTVEAFGTPFSNPLGIAAGFDKDARVADAVLAMGCGFAEIGTSTPKPQSGNLKPRIFRLVSDDGLINRLGFNNHGHQAALQNLKNRKANGPVAVNIGANKNSPDRVADYVAGIDAFYDVASFFVVNISSPNTPGLRDLQAPAALDALIPRLIEARQRHIDQGKPLKALVIKIAPDIAEDDLEPIVERLMNHEIDGIAVSNTTLARPGLTDPQAGETGGLSGRPLFHRSTVTLARVFEISGGKIPLIGIGGIDSGETALEKIEAGATLIELYTGLVYHGPGLIFRIKQHLVEACRQAGVTNVADLRGRRAHDWANKPLD